MWKDKQADMKILAVTCSGDLTTLQRENTTFIRNLILKIIKIYNYNLFICISHTYRGHTRGPLGCM